MVLSVHLAKEGQAHIPIYQIGFKRENLIVPQRPIGLRRQPSITRAGSHRDHVGHFLMSMVAQPRKPVETALFLTFQSTLHHARPDAAQPWMRAHTPLS